jgi:hypothetical protein
MTRSSPAEAAVSIAVNADGGASEVLSGDFMGLVQRTRMGILPTLALLCSHNLPGLFVYGSVRDHI